MCVVFVCLCVCVCVNVRVCFPFVIYGVMLYDVFCGIRACGCDCVFLA